MSYRANTEKNSDENNTAVATGRTVKTTDVINARKIFF